MGKNGAYTPEKTKQYERQVAFYARQAMKGKPIAIDAVKIEACFYMPIPKSYNALQRQNALNSKIRPIGKADCDNLLKSVLDGMNKVVYNDDNQVCDICASKLFAEKPRVEIRASWEE